MPCMHVERSVSKRAGGGDTGVTAEMLYHNVAIGQPQSDEVSSYYFTYINQVVGNDPARCLQQFDPHPTDGCESAVARHERGIQRFGKGQIRRVIARQVVAQLPNARQQDEVRIAVEGKVGQVGKGLGASGRGDDARASVAAQDLSDFYVEEMGGVQSFARCEDSLADVRCGGRLKQNLKDRGGVNDDQRPSLSARTAAAGAGRGRTRARPANRCFISSRVGRSTAMRTSRSR